MTTLNTKMWPIGEVPALGLTDEDVGLPEGGWMILMPMKILLLVLLLRLLPCLVLLLHMEVVLHFVLLQT
jgi:hypothetical protein